MSQIINQSRLYIALIALFFCFLFIVIISSMPIPELIAKFLFDKGKGSFFPYPLTIQNLMWCFFFVGLGELYFRQQEINKESNAFKGEYLPTDEKIVLTHQDMGEIYRKLKSAEDGLSKLIKSLILRFQAGRSVEQTHQMLNSQLEMWQYKAEIDYNMIRYLCWLIPTLGFIGTVVGIARTLNFAGSKIIAPESAEFLPALTVRLGVSFDTTLLALIMSAILVFTMHLIQGREEKIILQCGQYCLDNLITRLYVDGNTKE
jgi:biopolymer transport protein ExbB/TolQ